MPKISVGFQWFSHNNNLKCVCFLKQVERAFSVCGTIEYMAPEIVEGGESGHDKVICSFMFYAVACSIKSSGPDSPFWTLKCVLSPVIFFF